MRAGAHRLRDHRGGLGQRAVGRGFGLEHHGCCGLGRVQDGKQGRRGNGISNWRDRLKYWKDVDLQGNPVSFASERNYLPLWMRSIQPGTKQELGFQLAVPLCFCKTGTADDIILNIKNHIKTTDFNFNLIDFTVDRYIIDSVEGYTGDKYLVFRNDRITV